MNEDETAEIKRGFIWIKRGARHLRDSSNPGYVDLKVSKDGMMIAVKPRDGGRATGKSIKMRSGKIKCDGIDDMVDVNLISPGRIPYKTTYDAEKDHWLIDLSQPIFETTKKNITQYIRRNADLSGNTPNRLGKDELQKLLGCDSPGELLETLEQRVPEDDFSASITVNLNKSAYAKLAEDL